MSETPNKAKTGRTAEKKVTSKPSTGLQLEESTLRRWYSDPIVIFTAVAAAAAAVSAFAALTNMRVEDSNLKIAEGQAAITRMQYTPQLALNIDPPKHVDDARLGLGMTAVAHIKNVGSITVYNAEVAGQMRYIAADKISEIWTTMATPDKGVTLGPTEEETLLLVAGDPSEQQTRDIAAGKLALITGARIQFTDELGRSHARYACGSMGQLAIGMFCATPPQN